MRLPHSTPSDLVPSIVGCGGAVAVAWPWHVYEMPWVSTRPTAARASHRRCECSATAKLPSLVGDVKSIALSAPHSHRSLPSLAPIARSYRSPTHVRRNFPRSRVIPHTRTRARVRSPHREPARGSMQHERHSAMPLLPLDQMHRRLQARRGGRERRRGRRRDEEGDGERMGEVFDEEETTEGERERVGEGSHRPAVYVCCVCCVGGGVCSVLNVSSSATSHIPPHIK